jgi:hypothetical protein
MSAFDHRLFDRDQQRHGAFEARFRNEQDIVDKCFDDGLGEIPRRRDRDALSQRVAADREGRVFHGIQHRRIELSFDAYYLDLGIDCFGGDGHPRNQPAATDRHDKQIEIGGRLQHFERDRALPGNDLSVIERVNERHVVFGAIADSKVEGIL